MAMLSIEEDIYNTITKDMLVRLEQIWPNENVVFSPFSILMLLSILGDAAGGKTRKEIENVFGGKEAFEKTLKEIRKFNRELLSGRSFMSLNAVCIEGSIAAGLNSGYEDRVRRIFDGKVFSSENMVDAVNEWVNTRTKGMIPQIADKSMADIPACLLNAVAFNSEWDQPYEYIDIEPGDFHNSDGSVSEVDMMYSEENWYLENKEFVGFVKPYKDAGYSYVGLLPKKFDRKWFADGLKNLNISKLYKSKKHCRVKVGIPEYRYGFEEDLKGYCNDLGIRAAYSQGADFSQMTSEGLMIEKVLHKAYIQVDRNVTEASAVSAALFTFSGSSEYNDFRYIELNRPFVYGIVHDKTGVPVFMGVVNNLRGTNLDSYKDEEYKGYKPEQHSFSTKEERYQCAKEVYRRMVFKLHPDCNPYYETYDELKGYYEKVLWAYGRNDVRQLEILEHGLNDLLYKLGIDDILRDSIVGNGEPKRQSSHR